MLAALMNEKCVCVLVSHSGDTVSMVQAAKLAKAAARPPSPSPIFPIPPGQAVRHRTAHRHIRRVRRRAGHQRIAQLAIIESLFIIYRMRKSAQCDKALAITDHVIEETTKL
jgi:DNA-binding MurR/RpiR family transcriptional regulator